MKILLLADVKGQGKKGDVINVSDGYANNFLLNRGLGVIATADKINSVEIHNKAIEKQKAAERQKAQEDAARLKGQTIRITVATGSQGKMYGSITNKEIADELTALGYPVEKKQVILKEPIRTTGNYTAVVKLYAEISVTINIIIE